MRGNELSREVELIHNNLLVNLPLRVPFTVPDNGKDAKKNKKNQITLFNHAAT